MLSCKQHLIVIRILQKLYSEWAKMIGIQEFEIWLWLLLSSDTTDKQNCISMPYTMLLDNKHAR